MTDITRQVLDPNKIHDNLMMRAVAARRPLGCTFELTYKCNFQCPMCYVRMTDEQAKPFGRLRTVDEWIDMAHQVYDAGVLYLTFTGGECTLYPGFERLYEECSKMGFFITILSNAAAYTENIKKLFRKYPPHYVSITLYGSSAETYKRITGDPDGLDKVLNNVCFFQEIGSAVKFSFTMSRLNVHDYPEVVRIANSLSIPITVDADLTPHERDSSFSRAEELRLSPAEEVCVRNNKPEDVEKALQDAKKLEKRLAEYVPPKPSNPIINKPFSCNGSYAAATVFWNGEMQTCLALVKWKKYYPFKTSFEEAWGQIMQDHDNTFCGADLCTRCKLYSTCRRKCPGRNIEGTGNVAMPDPLMCQVSWLEKIYKEEYEKSTDTMTKIMEETTREETTQEGTF